jgi:gamma-glutamyl hydrolase
MINGLFIPGGETTFIIKNKKFISTVQKFFELSLQKDEYFPIWGTCFGFELLMFIIGNFWKLKQYPAHGFYPLHITPIGNKSRMLKSFPKSYLTYLEERKSCSNNHQYGISPTEFMENNHLRRFYNILATSIDDNGKEYVAIIEGKFYPIYGVQWHPERQKTMGHFVDFFISELQKNTHECAVYPHLRSYIKPQKCIQYPEHTNLSCYFF